MVKVDILIEPLSIREHISMAYCRRDMESHHDGSGNEMELSIASAQSNVDLQIYFIRH